MESAQKAGLTVLTSEQLIQTLPGYSAQVLTFSLMIGSLIVIASTVLGIFVYVLTLQKRPVLGILKARGVPTGYLIRSGCAQTLILSVAGIGIGLLLTVVTSLVLPSAVPFRLSGLLDLLIAAAFVLVSVIGGLLSYPLDRKEFHAKLIGGNSCKFVQRSSMGYIPSHQCLDIAALLFVETCRTNKGL